MFVCVVDFAFSLFHFHPSLVLVFVLFLVCLFFFVVVVAIVIVCSFVCLVEDFFPGVGWGWGFIGLFV